VTPAEKERKALFNEIKLYLGKQLDIYAERSDKNLEAHLNLEIKPLILEAIRESSERASEKSVVKYCRTINLDYHNIEHMNNHTMDLAWARRKRKREENFTGNVFSTLTKGAVLACLAAFIAKYFPSSWN